MTSQPLDNPVWQALTGPHARFGLAAGGLRRYQPEIAFFAAVERPDAEGLAVLAEALPETPVGFVTPGPLTLPPGVAAVRSAAVLQMVAQSFRPAPVGRQVEELGLADARAMLDLVELTRPGPFAPRTRELGRYVGVFEGEQLVAMAGERMRLAGHTEISAVCTHPDHRGRGHARALMSVIGAAIAARGETPFLHVYPDNAVAIAGYERLGFAPRRLMQFTIVGRA